MRKKWTEEGTLSYVHSEKAKKGSVMERGKKDRISSRENKTAEPELVGPERKAKKHQASLSKTNLALKT